MPLISTIVEMHTVGVFRAGSAAADDFDHLSGLPAGHASQLMAPADKEKKESHATEAEQAIKRALKHRKKGRVAALVAEAADGAETDPESAATASAAARKLGSDIGDDGAASKV